MSGWAPYGSDEIRLVVALQGDDGPDPRCVGLMLHPTRDEIVGSLIGTPAAEVGLEEAAQILGLPVNWPEHDRLVRLAEYADAMGKLPASGYIQRDRPE